ncbi:MULTISPECIES: erythromycin resistance leader peptide [Bacillales]
MTHSMRLRFLALNQ